MSTTVPPSPPFGWQILEELEGSPKYETTYRVQRAGAANGTLTRLVRIVRFGADKSSDRTRYVERLAAIADSPIPYLAPVEFWEDPANSVGSLEPEHIRTLASGANHAAAKFNSQDWDWIIEQLLTALAGLHSRKVQHGSVRPENIGMVPEPVDRNPPLVSLDYVATGTIAWMGLA